MPERNRVTPYGDIIVANERGMFMGNRGCLHQGHDIVRQWNGKRWITCVLEFRGRRAPRWEPGRYTALFFYDEAVAFAAGHRPCAECRHADYERYRDAWEAAFGKRLGADDMDRLLHADRVEGRNKRFHVRPWHGLPDGTFVDIDGMPALVTRDELHEWVPAVGYRAPVRRPTTGTANVITPASNVEVLRAGYVVEISPAGSAT
jgi:hypothetical protein